MLFIIKNDQLILYKENAETIGCLGLRFFEKKRKKEKIKWKKFKKGIWTKMTLNLSEESLYLEEFNKKVEWEKFPFLANQN